LDGVEAIYGFRLLGDGGGEWELAIANNQATIREGVPRTPDMTCVLEVGDFLDLVGGRVAGRELFFSGRMGVLGNAVLGMLLGRIME
jgi:putative sterol carrier protein